MRARDREVNFKLASVIISFVPEYVWKSEVSTFLDPCAQNGSLLYVVVQKLKQYGHSYQNIRGRVFGFFEDDYVKNYAINHFELIGNFGVINALECKIDETLGINFNINNKEYNMKFDVVVGNPPFQDNKDIDINGGSNKKLWKDFLYLSINNILKHEGYLCMICPFSWSAARKNPLNSINIYNDIIKKYNTIYIDTIQSNASFNIGIKVCYLIIKKIPYEHKTYLDNHIIDLAKWKSLPVDTSSVSLNIWDKINKFQKLNCIMVRKTINNKYCSNKKTKDNIYKLYTGSNNIIYTSIISEYYNRKKIIIHRMGNFICYIDGNGDVNPVYSHIYLLSNAEKGEYFKDILENKKLFRFLMNNLKTTQYNESYNTNKLPKIDFSRSWTNKELYEYFNLSEEEINYIESQVK